MKRSNLVRGFTLIELIAVIIILGVVGTTVVSFIGFSAQLFVDVNGRDKALADSRFVVERLNRELRNAIPNSVRVAGNTNIHCIEFMPIAWSSFYLDLPVSPEPASGSFSAIALDGDFDGFTQQASDVFIVYPISSGDIYNGASPKRVPIQSVPPDTDGDGIVDIIFQNNVQFPVNAESPASRFYIGEQPVSYCVSSFGQITRFTNYGILENQATSFNTNGALMGENLQNSLSSNPVANSGNFDDPFRVFESNLTRNAFVHILLRFAREDQPGEVLVFNNEVHVANVP